MNAQILIILFQIIKNKDNIKCLFLKKNLYEISDKRKKHNSENRDTICFVGRGLPSHFGCGSTMIFGCGNLDVEEMKTYIKSDRCNICDIAAIVGDLALLIYAHKDARSLNALAPWGLYTASYAAANGHLDCLQYAHKNGCLLHDCATAVAAKYGHLACLKYLHENGCAWDEEWATMFAAEGGHLECLKYAHENGCSWNQLTTAWAAGNGHLDCLKYAHENGCPWNVWTTDGATRKGHLECLEYAHKNGCPDTY